MIEKTETRTDGRASGATLPGSAVRVRGQEGETMTGKCIACKKVKTLRLLGPDAGICPECDDHEKAEAAKLTAEARAKYGSYDCILTAGYRDYD